MKKGLSVRYGRWANDKKNMTILSDDNIDVNKSSSKKISLKNRDNVMKVRQQPRIDSVLNTNTTSKLRLKSIHDFETKFCGSLLYILGKNQNDTRKSMKIHEYITDILQTQLIERICSYLSSNDIIEYQYQLLLINNCLELTINTQRSSILNDINFMLNICSREMINLNSNLLKYENNDNAMNVLNHQVLISSPESLIENNHIDITQRSSNAIDSCTDSLYLRIGMLSICFIIIYLLTNIVIALILLIVLVISALILNYILSFYNKRFQYTEISTANEFQV